MSNGTSGWSRPTRIPRNAREIVLTGDRVGWMMVVDMMRSSDALPGQANARVDIGVQDVDDQVDHDDHDPRLHHHALHQREVTLENSLLTQRPDTWPRQDHFH